VEEFLSRIRGGYPPYAALGEEAGGERHVFVSRPGEGAVSAVWG
jgi:hypothetical protein